MRGSSAPDGERQTAQAEPRAVGGLVAALTAIDARVSERLRHATERAGIRRLAAFVAHSADWWWWLIGAAALWLGGDARARPAILVVTATIVVTAITVQSLKWIVRRKRPSGERDFLSRHTDPHSFPSGHAARATALTVVGAALGPPWAVVALAPWAALVAVVRVALGVHYVSDVLVGIAIGVACGLGVAAWTAGGLP